MGLQNRPALPVRFLGLVTRSVLAEMLAHTYAEAKNIDPNEAYTRLDTALHDLRLIQGIQHGIWHGLIEKKPKLDDKEIVEHVAKRLEKSRRYKAWKPKRAEQGPAAALTVLMDQGAGYASGEATSLLYTPDGEKLLEKGLALVGAHIANEMLR